MATSRSKHVRTCVVIAMCAVAVLLVVSTRQTASTRSQPLAGPQTPSGIPPTNTAMRVPPPPGLDPDMLSARALREALAQYEQDSIYPPSSHLWNEDSAGQNQRWDRPFPVEDLFDDEPGRETRLRFAGDRHHVQFGEALVSTLEVAPVGRLDERMPLIIHSALVESARQGRTGVALVYRDDGHDGDAVANDHIYTNRFVPSEHDELSSASRVRLQVDLEANGVRKIAHLDFTYTPRPLLELVGLRSNVRDGALAIGLDLDVFDAGAYQITVDVLAQDGRTIGWVTESWAELSAGRAHVDLALFGKVIRDRGIAGPYTITNIRAEKRAEADEVEMWWADARSFSTAAFALDEFSPDAWDGPERQQAIAALEKAIDEQSAAEAATGN